MHSSPVINSENEDLNLDLKMRTGAAAFFFDRCKLTLCDGKTRKSMSQMAMQYRNSSVVRSYAQPLGAHNVSKSAQIGQIRAKIAQKWAEKSQLLQRVVLLEVAD